MAQREWRERLCGVFFFPLRQSQIRLPFFFLLSQLFVFRFLSELLVNGFWELADPDSVFGGRIFETSLEGLNETYILQLPCIGGGAEGGIQVAVYRFLQERSPPWEEMIAPHPDFLSGSPGSSGPDLGAHWSWTSVSGVHCSALLSRLREVQSGDDSVLEVWFQIPVKFWVHPLCVVVGAGTLTEKKRFWFIRWEPAVLFACSISSGPDFWLLPSAASQL